MDSLLDKLIEPSPLDAAPQRAEVELPDPTEVLHKLDCKELQDRHLEAIRLVSTGMAHKDAAEMVGLSAGTVSKIMQSSLAKHKLNELRQAADCNAVDILTQITEALPKAVEVMEDIMTGRMEGVSPSLQLKAAEALLDRGGYGRVSKIQSQVATVRITPEELNEIKSKAIETGFSRGFIKPAEGASDESV